MDLRGTVPFAIDFGEVVAVGKAILDRGVEPYGEAPVLSAHHRAFDAGPFVEGGW